LYNDLPWAIKVDLKGVEQEEQEKSRGDYSGIPDASEFRDSLVIFDDTEKMPNAKIEKMLYQLANVLAQNGRNFGTNVICILHQVNKGLQSTTLLREADTFIIFPRSYDMNTFNTLVVWSGSNEATGCATKPARPRAAGEGGEPRRW
jgi:hypothetical protein